MAHGFDRGVKRAGFQTETLPWDEISRQELPQSIIFVVFWSQHYPTAKGCVREIKQAADLLKKGLLRPIVVRLDDTPITNGDHSSSIDPSVFEALQPLLSARTSSVGATVHTARTLVERAAQEQLRSNHPRMPRRDLLESLRNALRKDRFTTYPAVWVSGFNGVGRETMVRDLNEAFTPNGLGFTIDVNEASITRQMRLRIHSDALGSDENGLRELNATPVNDEIDALVAAIDRVFSAGNYLIFKHRRIVEERVELPEWLNDVVSRLEPSTRPKLFLISQLPISAERRRQCSDTLVEKRISTINTIEMIDYAYELIGHFDTDPNRWPDKYIEKLVAASGGTISFLVPLVRMASGMQDFDQIDEMIEAEQFTMAQSITRYADWAFRQLRDHEEAQKVLLFLDNVSPCDVEDIRAAVQPQESISIALGKLLHLGLIELEADGLYRLTPLLSNRLNRSLLELPLFHRTRRLGYRARLNSRGERILSPE